MLIEFSVSNYLSIQSRQTLSLAAPDSARGGGDYWIETRLPGVKARKFLKTAAVFGGNGAGKSNLANALMFMIEKVNAGEAAEELGATYEPFFHGGASRKRPSEFDIQFVAEGKRYQYGFLYDPPRIAGEWLCVFPEGEKVELFTRGRNKKELKIPPWLRKAGLSAGNFDPEVLLLTMALESDIEELRDVCEWFECAVKTLDCSDEDIRHNLATNLLGHTPEYCEPIARIMEAFGLGIGSLDVEYRKDGATETAREILRESKIPPQIKSLDEAIKEFEFFRCLFKLSNAGGRPVWVTSSSLSRGTLKVFDLLVGMIYIVNQGGVLVIDDLEDHLEPGLARLLAGLMSDPGFNVTNAQFIVTTRNPVLWEDGTLDRDQVIVAKKDSKGRTLLEPLGGGGSPIEAGTHPGGLRAVKREGPEPESRPLFSLDP